MAGQYLVSARKLARENIVPLTPSDVLHGDLSHVHQNEPGRPDGTCYDWRSNGALKTWKTRPDDFRWPVKYGMYQFGAITPENVRQYHRATTCPVDAIDAQYYEALDRGEKPGAKLPRSAWGLSRRRRAGRSRPAWTGRAR